MELAGTGRAESKIVVTKVREDSEQRMIRLSVAHISRNLTERMTCFSVTIFVNAVDAVVHQLENNAVKFLQPGREREY